MHQFRRFLLTILILGWSGVLLSCRQGVRGIEISDCEFQTLSLTFSEPGGYFDTDNLISNEDSYQHVTDELRRFRGIPSVYVGVGPDQNFTYVCQARPSLAFILDIRPDNRLFVLYLNALIERSPSRITFLSRLIGRPIHHSAEASPEGIVDLIDRLQNAPRDAAFFAREFGKTLVYLQEKMPRLVDHEAASRLRIMVRSFLERGLELRFRSHGRPPRPQYPTLRELMLEKDASGNRRHYLQEEEDYQYLREMHLQNRIIPVVGNLAGGHALESIGKYAEQLELPVSTFYVSNVEFYLLREGSYRQFVRNVKNLPVTDESLFIRSYFGNYHRHPAARPGYFVTSLTAPIASFLAAHREEPFRSYAEIVMRDY